MKKSIRERKIEKNFMTGGISRSGFLGSDTRHIHDIILEDERILNRLGIDCESVSEKLQDFIEEGKKGLETWVVKGAYEVQVRWQRGMLPCPFGEPGLHHKLIANVHNTRTRKTIRFSQLNVHMIRDHGFFEGKGSAFRIEPEELAEFLKDL